MFQQILLIRIVIVKEKECFVMNDKNKNIVFQVIYLKLTNKKEKGKVGLQILVSYFQR